MHNRAEKKLTFIFAVTLFILVAEVAGGIWSNSIALLSDAGHVLTDAFAIGLSIIAIRIGNRPSDFKATYGYQRVGLLTAVINGMSLVAIAVVIFLESYHRFINPHVINSPLMIGIAGGGLIGNLLMAYILGHGHEDLNIKSAWLHIVGDTLSSVGVVISGIVIYYTGWVYADPIAGVFVGIIIIFGGVRVVKEALFVFLEFTPSGFDVEAIAKMIAELPDVLGVHDIHIWSLSHMRVAFTAHIWVSDKRLSELEPLKLKVEEMLRHMNIHHILLQFECAECRENALYCQICPDEKLHHHHPHD